MTEKVKISDLHKLLDLVDETTGKTELHISLDFTKIAGDRDYLQVSFHVFEDTGREHEPSNFTCLFSRCFYVGNKPYNFGDEDVKPYVECVNYLKGIINGVDGNVCGLS